MVTKKGKHNSIKVERERAPACLQSILTFDCGWKLNIKLHYEKETSCDCMCEYSLRLWKSGSPDSLCSSCIRAAPLRFSII